MYAKPFTFIFVNLKGLDYFLYICKFYLCFRPDESQKGTRQDSAIMSSKDKELLKLFIKK